MLAFHCYKKYTWNKRLNKGERVILTVIQVLAHGCLALLFWAVAAQHITLGTHGGRELFTSWGQGEEAKEEGQGLGSQYPLPPTRPFPKVPPPPSSITGWQTRF